jgi:hypothetical protein
VGFVGDIVDLVDVGIGDVRGLGDQVRRLVALGTLVDVNSERLGSGDFTLEDVDKV